MSSALKRSALAALAALLLAACTSDTPVVPQPPAARSFAAGHPCPPGLAKQDRCPTPPGPDTTPAIASVATEPAELTLPLGDSTQLQAIVTDAGGTVVDTPVAWSSLDTMLARVDSTGRVRTLGVGPARIRASLGELADTTRLTIEAPPAPVDTTPAILLTVSPETATVAVGGTLQLGAAGAPADSVVRWESLDTAVAAVATVAADTARVVARAPGVALVVGRVGAAADTARVTVVDTATAPPPDTAPPSSGPVLPELPRAWVDTRMPSISRIVPVSAGADLQAALTAAQPGDELQLECGGTWAGNFTLPPKTGWVVLTTACPLPPEGTRRGPTPTSRIESPNVLAALKIGRNSGFWRIVGLEIASNPQTTTYAYGLVVATTQDVASVAEYAHDWILDRVWIHPADDSKGVQRCIALNAVRAAVIDSYLQGCHYKGADSQAIGVWDTPGPLKITNNYLEGAGENVMFGGAKAVLPGVVPSDLEVRRNYFFKPLSWQGGLWTVKNLFETKNARRLLVEGNVFENNWADGQTGVAILLKSSIDSGNWSTLEDVTFRYNIIRNSPKGLETLGHRQNDATSPEEQSRNRRVLIAHNLFEAVGSTTVPSASSYWSYMVYQGGENFVFDHNTFATGSTSAYVMFSGRLVGSGFRFTNNVGELGTYGIRGDGSISGSGEGVPALDAYQPGWVVSGNVIGADGHANLDAYPPDNHYPAARADEVAADGSYTGSYRGPDGSVPGADLAAVRAATAGVVP